MKHTKYDVLVWFEVLELASSGEYVPVLVDHCDDLPCRYTTTTLQIEIKGAGIIPNKLGANILLKDYSNKHYVAQPFANKILLKTKL